MPTLRGPAFLGFPEVVAQNYCVVTTTSLSGLVPTTMPASNIKTDEPSDITRLTILDPKHTQWVFNQSGIENDLDGFALINHNLYPGSSFRVLGFQDVAVPWAYSIQAPNDIAASTNITGGVGNIDEVIDTPDGLVITPTVTTSAWTVRFSFANLSDTPPKQNYGMSFFVLRMRRNFSGAGATDPLTVPKVTVELYENGFPKTNLGYRPVTETVAGGQVLIFPFAFSVLSDPALGSGIEVLLTVTPGTSTSGGQYASLESLALYYEQDTFLIPMQDSGWIDVVGGKTSTSPTASDHYFTTFQWQEMQSVVLLIRSDQVEHTAKLKGSDQTIPYLAINSTPYSYIDAGVFRYGNAEFLSIAVQQNTGPNSKISSASIESGYTLGGQSYTAELFRRRSISLLSMIVTRDELKFLQNDVAWEKGTSSPFYIALEPDLDKSYQKFTSFFAVLTELGEPIEITGYRPGSDMLFNVSVGLEEKL